ncbi:transglycosylase SLT domain-containing protein [Nocardia callitridis]|uniref:Transglycosylase SLT domain-containing protein n=1 Tax=Nocardia callitridis TaxID=648753 RepID=A0ABP9K5P0_9NOCA
MSETADDDWELIPPDGATEGLVAVIGLTSETLRASARQVASGDPASAPDMLAELREHKLLDNSDKSRMAKNYTKRTGEIDDIKKSMHSSDSDVDTYSSGTYGTSSTTYGELKQAKTDLQPILSAPAPAPDKKYLTPAAEAPLIKASLDTADKVHRLMDKASEDIREEARKISAATQNQYQGNGAMPAPLAQAQSSLSSPYLGPAPTQSYAPYTGSTTVDQAIDQALDALGITDPVARNYWKLGYRVLIERESGGDPNSTNNWDSNAAAGNSSVGLAQVIPTTFAANHVAGTSDNPKDPVANVAASMQYVMRRYDVSADGHDLQAKVQQADPMRSPKGY